MAVDVRVIRSNRERDASARVRRQVERDLARIRKAAEEIRQMTRVARIYQERLDGRRDDAG